MGGSADLIDEGSIDLGAVMHPVVLKFDACRSSIIVLEDVEGFYVKYGDGSLGNFEV